MRSSMGIGLRGSSTRRIRSIRCRSFASGGSPHRARWPGACSCHVAKSSVASFEQPTGGNLSSTANDLPAASSGAQPKSAGLERGIDWTGAFWVASGVPPLVLFSIGAVAATVGKPSWLVWMVSIGLGFVQSMTYAEIAGLFPHKAGGTSVYGAIAWVRYSKIVAPLSVWCNCFAWSPVLAIGSGLAAGYILTGLFAPDSLINTWQITLFDLGAVKSGLTIRINA